MEVMKYIELSNSFKELSLTQTNSGYMSGETEYYDGSYILQEYPMAEDMDGDEIISDGVYLFAGNEEFYKIDSEDFEEGLGL